MVREFGNEEEKIRNQISPERQPIEREMEGK